MEEAIRVEQLSKLYGPDTGAQDITLSVRSGEIFGVVGPNGAGKTTIIECLIGLRRPDSGTIHVLGLNPTRQKADLLQRVGIQLQKAELPAQMKVWEALQLFASFYRHTVQWESLLKQWDLTEKRSTSFQKLSGGQRQRLFITLALLNDPDVVILDELTTGLDPQARHHTWELIEAIRGQGKTVVLVTHYMEEAERLCDRVAIVDHSRLIALDTPQHLIRQHFPESRLRFSVSGNVQLDWLNSIADIKSTVRENSDYIVSSDINEGILLTRIVTALTEHKVIPQNLRIEQVTLEDVFLALTGHHIRD